jgi:hypothetical protein
MRYNCITPKLNELPGISNCKPFIDRCKKRGIKEGRMEDRETNYYHIFSGHVSVSPVYHTAFKHFTESDNRVFFTAIKSMNVSGRILSQEPVVSKKSL